MADISAWSSQQPSGASLIRLGDDRMRSNQSALEAALNDEHYFVNDSASSASGGVHRLGSARPYVGLASSASTTPDDGRLLIATDSGQLFSLTTASIHTHPALGSINTWRDTQFFIAASASSDPIAVRVSSDTANRFALNADGKQEWGPGNAAFDTNLYRAAADHLKTDDTFEASVISTPTLQGISNLSVSNLTTAKLVVGAAGAPVLSIITGIAVFPTQTVTGGQSVFTNILAGSVSTGDTAAIAIEANPSNRLVIWPNRVTPAGVRIDVSNHSTEDVSLSTTTVYVTVIRHSS